MDRALVPDVMVIPGSSGSLQMVDHTLIDVTLANVYWIPHTTKDPNWKAEDQPIEPGPVGTTRTKITMMTRAVIYRLGCLTSLKSNQEKTEKSAPKKGDSNKKAAQPKLNDNHAKRSLKVKEGAT